MSSRRIERGPCWVKEVVFGKWKLVADKEINQGFIVANNGAMGRRRGLAVFE
jgi:hypothetical protein